jgi:hypothetical protein
MRCDGLDKVPSFRRLQYPAALHCFVVVYSLNYLHFIKHFSRVFPCVVRAARLYISSEKYPGEVDRVIFSSPLQANSGRAALPMLRSPR